MGRVPRHPGGHTGWVTVHARLVATRAPRRPDGVVLLVHGGAAREDRTAVSPYQPSVLRMIPIARRIASAGRGRLAVFRLLNSTRGWDTRHTPVDDLRWALERVRERYGAHVPACLVGHSLGGRAVLLAAGTPGVRSVVALNPWVYATEGRHDAGGRRILVVHGSADRVADLSRALAVATNLRRTADVGVLTVRDGTHSMLRHRSVFDRAAADFARATLLGDEVGGAVGEVLAGGPEATVEVG